jgi:hypothetical protein
MALSTFQKSVISKEEFTNQAVNIATEIARMRARWNFFAEFVNDVSAADATELGYTGPEAASLAALRGSVNNIIAAIDAEASLEDFRRILVS